MAEALQDWVRKAIMLYTSGPNIGCASLRIRLRRPCCENVEDKGVKEPEMVIHRAFGLGRPHGANLE